MQRGKEWSALQKEDLIVNYLIVANDMFLTSRALCRYSQ
jgi:hypothetical protein